MNPRRAPIPLLTLFMVSAFVGSCGPLGALSDDEAAAEKPPASSGPQADGPDAPGEESSTVGAVVRRYLGRLEPTHDRPHEDGERGPDRQSVEKAAPAVEPSRELALRILREAAVGDDPALRSNAIEALSLEPDQAPPVVQRGLGDANPGVRFAAVVTAGRLMLAHLADSVRPLLEDENRSVRAAAIYALHRFGRRIDLTPLADMLTDRDPRLRANVALLLGLLGDESAVPMLKRAAATPMHRTTSAAQAAVVRVQIAEAIARLDETAALDALRAGAYSPFGEVRVLSINAMGAVGDRRMELALEQMLADPPVEVQLAAAAALARLDNAQGLTLVIEKAADEDPVVRAQAAWVLGWFDQEQRAAATLRRLMADEQSQVRISAAASILRLGPPADPRPRHSGAGGGAGG